MEFPIVYFKHLLLRFVFLFFILSVSLQAFTQNNIWEQTGGPLGGHMQSLALNNSGQLFAGGDGGIFKYTDESGWVQTYAIQWIIPVMASNSSGQLFAGTWARVFYRSLDFGETWEGEYPINDERRYILSIDINSDDDIFISTMDKGIYRSDDLGDTFTAINNGLTTGNIRACAFNANGQVFAVSDSGVFKSSTNGSNWVAINQGLTDLDIQDIAINNSDDIFIISRDYIFKSEDNGDNWTQLENNVSKNKYVIAINASGHIFVGVGSGYGSKGVYRSTNNGDTWTPSSQGLTDKGVYEIIFDPNGRIYAVTSDNIYYSDSDGVSWTSMNKGLKATTTYAMLCSAGNYLVVVNNDGIFRSGNQGQSWSKTSSVRWLYNLASDPNNGNIYAGPDNSEILRSTNDGATWQDIGGIKGEVEGIAINSQGHIFVLVIGHGVVRSTDNGASWSEFENQLTSIRLSSIIIDSNDIVYVSTSWDGLFRSEDSGETWTSITNPVEGSIRDFEINYEGTMYAATYYGHIFKTDDRGDSWQEVGTDMWSNVSDLTIHPNGDIYAACSYGVFRFDKDSDKWIRFNDGFGFGFQTSVYKLSIDSSDYLYSGVWGNSVFRTKYPIIASIPEGFDVSSPFSLDQNYPNPFNRQTTISYTIKNKSIVRLSVFDITGREVETIVDQSQNAGTYSASFDASILDSGFYFYKLQVDEIIQSRKMLVMH